MFKSMKTSGSFALVEFLMVFSIISVLASLLLPALKKTRLKAIQISCVSNLKRSGLAMLGYTNDYIGRLMSNDH